MEPTAGTVALAALVTALATGLGALAFIGARTASRSRIGLSSAAAAGFMAAATALLAWEGAVASAPWMVVGAIVGIAALGLFQRALGHHDDLHVGELRGADASRAITIVAVMTVHSFAEGVGIGVAYADGATLGLVIAFAIAVHNIPEGLAISAVLVPRGATVAAAAGWSIVSSLPQPVMAVPAFLFVESFGPLLAPGLGFAAGAMAWMVACQLIPDARANARPLPLAGVFAVAFAAMAALEIFLVAG